MLSDPQKGDLFAQRAIIIEKIPPKVGNRISLLLHISDGNGCILEPRIPKENEITMFEENFRDQFKADPELAETFIGYFRIYEYESDSANVRFCRIKADGKSDSHIKDEERGKFLKTHFLVQDFDVKKTTTAEEEIIDLEEEAT